MKWLSGLVIGCALFPGLAACEGEIGPEEPVPPVAVLQAPRPVADESDVARFLGQWFAVTGNTRTACQNLSGTSEEVPLASPSLLVTPGPEAGQVAVDDGSGCLINATVAGDEALGVLSCPGAPRSTLTLAIQGDTLITQVTVLIDAPKFGPSCFVDRASFARQP